LQLFNTFNADMISA